MNAHARSDWESMGAIGPGRGRRRFCRRRSTARPSRDGARVPVGGELVELSRLDIGFCIGCNRCLAQTSCTLADDMNDLYEKLRDADVVLLASPGLLRHGERADEELHGSHASLPYGGERADGQGGRRACPRPGSTTAGERGRSLLWTAGSPPRACSPSTRALAGAPLVRRRGGHGLRGARARTGQPLLALREGRRDRLRPGPAAGPRGRLVGRAPCC